MANLEPILFSQSPRDFRLLPPAPKPTPRSNPSQWTEQELNDLKNEAYQRGHTDGQKALNDQLMTQRKELLELQHGVFNSLRESIPKLIRDSEMTLAELALEVARKMVAQTPVDAEMIQAAIRETLDQTEESSEFLIDLHPDDLELLKKIDSELLTPTPHPPHFQFHANTELTRGGCLVKTRFGILDASRENKFQIIKQAVLS